MKIFLSSLCFYVSTVVFFSVSLAIYFFLCVLTFTPMLIFLGFDKIRLWFEVKVKSGRTFLFKWYKSLG